MRRRTHWPERPRGAGRYDAEMTLSNELPRRRRFSGLWPLLLVLGGCKPAGPASTPPQLDSLIAAGAGSLFVTVAFCVDPGGNTVKVEVLQPSGDAKVDEIARAQVERMKFHTSLRGKCSEADFNIEVTPGSSAPNAAH